MSDLGEGEGVSSSIGMYKRDNRRVQAVGGRGGQQTGAENASDSACAIYNGWT